MSYKQISHLIPASHGQLEAITFMTADRTRAMIVTHPHPLFGGNLHNKVSYSLADESRKAGISAVRFNFRGVGKSTGLYDSTIGETQDLRTVIHYVTESAPVTRLYLAGFSFGSRVILNLLEEGYSPDGVILAGLPVRFFNIQPCTVPADYPLLCIQGENDDFTSPADTRNFLQNSRFGKAESVTLPETDHFFTGKIHLLKQHVQTFIQTHF